MKNYFFILFSISFSLFNCGGGDSSQSSWEVDTTNMEPKDHNGDWIIVHELSDTDGLNPFTSTGAGGTYIYGNNIFEGMLVQDNKTLAYVPQIATSRPTVSEDKKTYTFTLRKDVTFSDGTPLTGEDVIFSLKSIKNPFTDAAPLRNYYKDVAKAELVNGDPYTVKFTCSEVYFKHEVFIGSALYVLPKHVYDPNGYMDEYSFDDLNKLLYQFTEENSSLETFKNEPAYMFADYFNSHEVSRNPIGSGPYVFKEWRTDDRIILEKNDNYWRASEKENLNAVSKLVHKTVKQHDAALTGLKAQEIDLIRSLPPELFFNQTNSAKFNKNNSKESYYYPNYSYIGWNNEHPIFADKRVRRAMTHLCNRDKITEILYYGEAKPAIGSVYYKRPEFNHNIEAWEFNPEKAKQLLAEAGWRDSDNDGVLDKVINGKLTPFEFEFKTNQGNEIRKKIGLIMVEELRKVGISADVHTMEWSVYLDNVRDHKFDAMILGWVFGVDSPDPYQVFHSTQAVGRGSNSVSFKHDRADKIIEQNRKEFDAEVRKTLMLEFQEILHEEQPYTFLVCSKSHLVHHKRFKGIDIYPFRPGYDLQEWWVPTSIQKYSK
jgi:peptide/nickel transport system substrate-binding protein